jgi:hypothetical protein
MPTNRVAPSRPSRGDFCDAKRTRYDGDTQIMKIGRRCLAEAAKPAQSLPRPPLFVTPPYAISCGHKRRLCFRDATPYDFPCGTRPSPVSDTPGRFPCGCAAPVSGRPGGFPRASSLASYSAVSLLCISPRRAAPSPRFSDATPAISVAQGRLLFQRRQPALRCE